LEQEQQRPQPTLFETLQKILPANQEVENPEFDRNHRMLTLAYDLLNAGHTSIPTYDGHAIIFMSTTPPAGVEPGQNFIQAIAPFERVRDESKFRATEERLLTAMISEAGTEAILCFRMDCKEPVYQDPNYTLVPFDRIQERSNEIARILRSEMRFVGPQKQQYTDEEPTQPFDIIAESLFAEADYDLMYLDSGDLEEITQQSGAVTFDDSTQPFDPAAEERRLRRLQAQDDEKED